MEGRYTIAVAHLALLGLKSKGAFQFITKDKKAACTCCFFSVIKEWGLKMRIDQRKKWYQKIKYNKNFKVVSFITIILIFVVGYVFITGKSRMGENTTEDSTESSGSLVETVVIEAPDDPTADLKQYASSDTDDNSVIQEYDYTIQGAGSIAAKKKPAKTASIRNSSGDRTSGGRGDGGSSVVISGMENSVRVILTNGGNYKQSYVEFSCNTAFSVTSDGKKKEYKANELVSLGSDAKASSIVVQPDSSDGRITVSSLSKSGGSPSYHGVLDITKDSGGFLIVNQVDIEQYLYGVVSSEVSASYNKEALKAQAICARGFTYRKLGSNYNGYNADLDDTTACQVYNNFPETDNSIAAVQETAGIVPTYNGEIINAVYFSTSCGTTTTSDQVWGGSMPYTCTRIQNTALDIPHFSDEDAFRDFMDGKTDTDVVERDYPMYRWTVTYTEDEMRSAIETGLSRCSDVSATSVGKIESIEMTGRDDSGLVKEVTIKGSDGTVVVSGQNNIRVLFATDGKAITEQDGSELTGWTGVPSNFYYVKKDNNMYILKGGGYGHGVGMSQNGANALAGLGYSAGDIISHYYNGAVLSSVE